MNKEILARLKKTLKKKKQVGEESRAGVEGIEHKVKKKKKQRREGKRSRITRQRTDRRRRQRKKTHLAYESEIRRTNGAATLAYLWTNMPLFGKKPQELGNKQNQKIRASTFRCVYIDFMPEHTVSVGLIILALVHIPHQKDWNGNITWLCNTWASISCSLPGNSISVLGILYITSALHHTVVAW